MNATAADIRASLKRHFVQPASAIVFEVSTGTGHKVSKFVDAVVMDLWPSRGLALTAVEIKISRGDFQREIKQPEKSEAIAKFCDYFAIAAPKGMLKAHELPVAWGLWEIDDKGKMRETVKPRATPPQEQVSRDFLAAMLRAAGRVETGFVDSVIVARTKELEAAATERERSFFKRVQDAADLKLEHPDYKNWSEFLATLDDGKRLYLSSKEVISAVKLVLSSGVAQTFGTVATIAETLGAAHREVAKAMAAVKMPGATPAASTVTPELPTASGRVPLY